MQIPLRSCSSWRHMKGRFVQYSTFSFKMMMQVKKYQHIYSGTTKSIDVSIKTSKAKITGTQHNKENNFQIEGEHHSKSLHL